MKIAHIAHLLAAVPTSILQGVDPNNSDPNIGGLNAVPILIHNAVNIALFIAGGLSVIFFIVGGMRFALSSGNPANTKQARETMLYAIIGLVVSLGSFAILNYVVNIFPK